MIVTVNKFHAPAEVSDSGRGMLWPEHRILPALASPADTLDAIAAGELDDDEKLMFACLEGLVNREKPRLFIIPECAAEGNEEWPRLLGLKLRRISHDDMWQLVKKYRSSFTGAVLFSCDHSVHCVNLATTLAGIRDALPLTSSLYRQLKVVCGDIPVTDDLRRLTCNDAVGVYTYMYENVWDKCTRRLILSASPDNRHFMRDMAVCARAAVIWTENRDETEQAVYKRFLADMEPGNAAAVGWYTEERSGIGTAAQFGLSTIPSDYYENSTVYAGMAHEIKKPPIPKLPPLENKVYAAIYLSDGDNTQYNQHVMLNLWKNPDRGSIPINWTISPVLSDFGPGLMNYYYSTATSRDCFVSGPSGAGYSLLVDRHNRRVNLTDKTRAEKYARLSDRYLEKAGIHSITIWDEITDMQADVYDSECRSLYGATVVDWRMLKKPLEQKERGNVFFVPNDPGYSRDIEPICKTFADKIAKWDGCSPLFLSAQGISWNMTPKNIKTLAAQLEALAPGRIEIVRADHFFALLNKSSGKAYNICLEDGCEAETAGDVTVMSLGGEYKLTRIRARGDGEIKAWASADGVNYTELFDAAGCSGGADVDFDAVCARFVKVEKVEGARGDVEIFGRAAL